MKPTSTSNGTSSSRPIDRPLTVGGYELKNGCQGQIATVLYLDVYNLKEAVSVGWKLNLPFSDEAVAHVGERAREATKRRIARRSRLSSVPRRRARSICPRCAASCTRLPMPQSSRRPSLCVVCLSCKMSSCSDVNLSRMNSHSILIPVADAVVAPMLHYASGMPTTDPCCGARPVPVHTPSTFTIRATATPSYLTQTLDLSLHDRLPRPLALIPPTLTSELHRSVAANALISIHTSPEKLSSYAEDLPIRPRSFPYNLGAGTITTHAHNLSLAAQPTVLMPPSAPEMIVTKHGNFASALLNASTIIDASAQDGKGPCEQLASLRKNKLSLGKTISKARSTVRSTAKLTVQTSPIPTSQATGLPQPIRLPFMSTSSSRQRSSSTSPLSLPKPKIWPPRKTTSRAQTLTNELGANGANRNQNLASPLAETSTCISILNDEAVRRSDLAKAADKPARQVKRVICGLQGCTKEAYHAGFCIIPEPPPRRRGAALPALHPGMRVRAPVERHGRKYPGVLESVNNRAMTCSVRFDDGDHSEEFFEDGMPNHLVEPLEASASPACASMTCDAPGAVEDKRLHSPQFGLLPKSGHVGCVADEPEEEKERSCSALSDASSTPTAVSAAIDHNSCLEEGQTGACLAHNSMMPAFHPPYDCPDDLSCEVDMQSGGSSEWLASVRSSTPEVVTTPVPSTLSAPSSALPMPIVLRGERGGLAFALPVSSSRNSERTQRALAAVFDSEVSTKDAGEDAASVANQEAKAFGRGTTTTNQEKMASLAGSEAVAVMATLEFAATALHKAASSTKDEGETKADTSFCRQQPSSEETPMRIAREQRKRKHTEDVKPEWLSEGANVVAFGFQNGRATWFEGVVTLIEENGKCRVEFDDGDKTTIEWKRLKPRK